VLTVVWYRFRATFRRRWGGYLAIVLLVGLVGGLAMASLAGARRTQSSFPTFLASTGPSDLTIAVFPPGNVTFGSAGGYSASLTRAIKGLPGVTRVESWVQPFGVELSPRGIPETNALSDVTAVGSLDGLSFNMDRPGVVEGRMADPTHANEFVTTAAAAEQEHWHVGEVVPFGFYTEAQIASANFAKGAVKPTIPVEAKLVGLVEFSDGVVQDEVDRFPTFALFTPALTRTLVAKGMTFATYYGVQTAKGSQDVAAVERALEKVIPPDTTVQEHLTSLVAAKSERAIKPESIALGVFGGIAALVALVIGAQAIARQSRAGRVELEVLRALGADPLTVMGDGLVGAFLAVVVGALLAGAVAVALSPLAPIGPVRPVYPTRGIAFDGTVLGAGVAVLVVVLAAFSLVLGYRSVPSRSAGRRSLAPLHRHVVADAGARAGLRPSVVVGLRFALDPGDARTAVPVRSVLFGTALAVTVVTATLTFGSGLSTLVAHPALYGWNWSYALFSETGPDVPPQAVALLGHDPKVAAYSLATLADPEIDGQTIPAIFERANAPVVPPILNGHAPQSDHQIVLGAATLKQLGTSVGGTVTVTYGSKASAPYYLPPTVLHVVGTATMPAIGFPSSEGDHTSMGTGALLPNGVIPASFQKALANGSPDRTLDGPEFVFVRMQSRLGRSASRADIQRIVSAGNKAFASAPNGDGTGDTVLVKSDLLPAEIVNYRTMGATPALVAAGLAVGAVVALGLTLISSVRRRRRDLALLKTLGFTGRQVSASLAVQATVVGIVGLVVGLPAGIALGRWLWVLFAHQIYAVPEPTVPVVALVLVGVAVLLLVNLVAVLPGRAAARTPAALVLRAE
jgi:FtsX-like permease family